MPTHLPRVAGPTGDVVADWRACRDPVADAYVHADALAEEVDRLRAALLKACDIAEEVVMDNRIAELRKLLP